jgi:hypothetical protein
VLPDLIRSIVDAVIGGSSNEHELGRLALVTPSTYRHLLLTLPPFPEILHMVSVIASACLELFFLQYGMQVVFDLKHGMQVVACLH